ncbi:MAG: SOS response-associated peptidase [Caldilineaceae bacterium]|nr:SOS response-associated peptidase [Caldilineaceae bacterium]
MCGRFTLHANPNVLATLFGLSEEPTVVSRYNIAPTQPVAVVRLRPQDHEREWALVRWGLVPSWSKEPSIGSRMINARSETVSEKPSFRAAFKRRRCLIPSDGFFEWQRIDKAKQPYFIHLADGGPFAFAGLWEQWAGADGSEMETCTILTCEPNELVASLHNRMPVIVAPEDYEEWLGPGPEQNSKELSLLRHLLRPYPADKMAAYPVSTYVNSPAHEGAECVQPL